MSDSIKWGQLKSQIDKLRTERIREEGNLEALERELKEDFHCSSSEEAREKAQKMYIRADNLESRIQDGIQEIRDEYGI